MTPRRLVVVCSVLLACLGAGAPVAAGSPDVPDARPSPYRMVSVDDRGRPANDGVYGASVSRDGRWVVFGSRSTNLDRRPRHGLPQVFLRDNRTERVRVASVDRRGRPVSAAESASLSPSGRFLAFCSSDDVVGPDVFDPGLDTVHTDVFVRDLRTGKVRRASSPNDGGMGDDYSCVPDVADTGDVVFFSRATNLVAGDSNGVPDYFRWDWSSRKVRRLATAEIATHSARISADGGAVAVVTTEVLAARDSGQLPDVYVLERGQGGWRMPLVQETGLPTDTGCGWTGLSLSRTGRWLTAGCADGGVADPDVADKPVHLWWTDRRTGRVRLVNRTPDIDSEVDVAQVSDDGRRVFFGSRERDYARTPAGRRARQPYEGVFLWERGEGVRRLTPGADVWWDDYGFDASGDGRTVAFASLSNELAGREPDADATMQLFTRRVR